MNLRRAVSIVPAAAILVLTGCGGSPAKSTAYVMPSPVRWIAGRKRHWVS